MPNCLISSALAAVAASRRKDLPLERVTASRSGESCRVEATGRPDRGSGRFIYAIMGLWESVKAQFCGLWTLLWQVQ